MKYTLTKEQIKAVKIKINAYDMDLVTGKSGVN